MADRTTRKRKLGARGRGGRGNGPTTDVNEAVARRTCVNCGQFVAVHSYSHHLRQCGRDAGGEGRTGSPEEGGSGSLHPVRPSRIEVAKAAFRCGIDAMSLMPHQQAPVPEHLRNEDEYLEVINFDEVEVTREPAAWWKYGEGEGVDGGCDTSASLSSGDESSVISRLSHENESTPNPAAWFPPDAMNLDLPSDQGDVRFQFEATNKSSRIFEVKEWSWYPPEEMADGPLKKILSTPEGKHLGRCFYFPLEDEAEATDCRLNDQEISMLRLIDLCNQKAATGRGFVDQMLEMVAGEMDGPRQFDPRNLRGVRRETLCKKVMRLYGRGCEPHVVQITTSSESGNLTSTEEPQDKNVGGPGVSVPKQVDNRERFVLHCIVFDIEAQIKDLLSDDRIFGKYTNLVVNSNNPFLPYQNMSEYVDEILDGTWHVESLDRLRKMEEDPFVDGVDWILHLLLYNDKTGSAGNQRYPVEPFLFTFAQIRRKLRNLPQCWRIAGYIPDLDTKSSAERRHINNKNRGATAQTYHLCLEQVLKGFEIVQKQGILHWVRIGNYKKYVRVRPEVAFVISDGKAADMNTGRTPSTFHTRRISRSCTTLQQDCDDVLRECQYLELTRELHQHFKSFGVSPKAVQEDPFHRIQGNKGGSRPPTAEEAAGIVERARIELDKRSFVPARNAFIARCIRFGLDSRRIWGASPTDLMHAFQSGIVKYLVKMVVDKLSTAKQVRLDRLVHKLFHNLRSKEKGDYPRLTFSKGFSKLSMITSDEWVGKLFVLLIVLKTEEGSSIFQGTFAREDIQLPPALVGRDKGDRKNRKAKGFADVLDLILRQAKEFNTGASALINTPTATGGTEEAQEQKQSGKNEEELEEMLRPCSMNDFTELAEALLCFHAWYKLGVIRKGPDGKADRSLIHASVIRMLAMVRFYMPRKKGNGWKIQKFHDILHLALDIERFGPACNFDAGPGESGLKIWAKLPAMTSQKRGYNTFLLQVASRVHEHQCISTALRSHGVKGNVDAALDRAIADLENAGVGETCEDRTARLGGTTYRVYGRNPNAGANSDPLPVSEKVSKDKRNKGSFHVHPSIENFLRWQPIQNPSVLAKSGNGSKGPYWELKTECSMVPEDSNRRILLRCHPNFQNEGPWYDWVLVNFSTDLFFHKPGRKRQYEARKNKKPKDKTLEPTFDPMQHVPQNPDNCVPCKVVAFSERSDGELLALVHGCKFRTTNSDIENDTVLLEFWRLEYHNLYEDLPDEMRNKLPRKTKRQPGIHDYEVPFLCWVPLKSIVSRCFVLEEEPGLHEVQPYTRPAKGTPKPVNRVILVRPHPLWPEEFTSTDE